MATAHYRQDGTDRELSTAWFVGRPVPPPPPVDPGTHFVSDLPFVSSTNGYGPVERDQSVGGQLAGDGAPITVGGQEYAKGLGAHAPSEVLIDLDGCTGFTAVVGQDAEDNRGSLAFQVEGDGRVLWRSPTLTGTATARPRRRPDRGQAAPAVRRPARHQRARPRGLGRRRRWPAARAELPIPRRPADLPGRRALPFRGLRLVSRARVRAGRW